MPSSNVVSDKEEDDRVRSSRERHKRKCYEANCVHHYTCAEILLRPELLQGSRGLSASSNPLLEFCLDGEIKCKNKPIPEPVNTSFLLFHCSNPLNLDVQKLKEVCQKEYCDINVQNYRGFSALHFIIQGCSKSSIVEVTNCLKVLIESNINLNLLDTDGNSALHALDRLLSSDMPDEAYTIADLLLRSGIEANLVNKAGRSFLSLAVERPNCRKLVRLCLDHGARVRTSETSESAVEAVINDRERSAFTRFLKACVRSGKLSDDQRAILCLLCHSMAEEDPISMKKHVLSTMMHLGRSYRVLGPLFEKLKRIAAPFWTGPQPLKYLCKRKIRKTIGIKKIASGSLLQLRLPDSLRRYLELQREEL